MSNREGTVGKRPSGIEVIDDFLWGTHISTFYNSKNDLLEILVPFFKAGIESNEFCLWTTVDAFTANEAFNALNEEIPRLGEYINSGKVEILPVGSVNEYEKSVHTHNLIDHWLEKLQAAENRGMAGMRIHDVNACSEATIPKKFIEHESYLRHNVADKKMIVLCTYPLSKFDAITFIDIAQAHEHIVTRRNGKWEIIALPHVKKWKRNILTGSTRKSELSCNDKSHHRNKSDAKDAIQNATNITIEEDINKRALHYKEIFEKASDAILILERGTGKIIDVNHKAVVITGYSKEELLDKHPTVISSQNNGFSKKEVDEKINSLLLSESSLFEWEMRRNDGSINWINVNISAASIAGEERILFFFHEIAAHKAVQLSLLQSESNYRHLFENNPASIYIWDPFALKIIEVNNTALKMYGYDREEFLNLSTLDLRPEEDRSRYYEFLKFAQSDGDLSLKAGVWRHVTKSGEIIFVDITSHKIQYRGIQAVLSLNINVTEKVLLEKRIEEERVKKQHELTDAVFFAEERERQEIGRELHDNVNQLLATSRLYLGLTGNDESQNIQNIKEADHLIELAINEIRNLSHAMISPMLEKSGLINALKYLMDAIAKGSELQFEYNFEGIREELMSDKLKLSIYRIVQEQLSNILKYAKADKVTLQLSCNKKKHILTIRDNGIGFNCEEKSNGIGLMNIHTRASLFNGTVQVVSSVGNGCELIVDFVSDTDAIK